MICVKTKICSLCNEEKNIDEYYYNKSRKKYFSKCKECINKETLQRYKNNRKKIKIQKQEYYKKNKEKLLQKSKENYYNNLDNKKEQSRKYYYKNKDRRNEYSKKYNEEHQEEIKKQRHNNYIQNKECIKERQHKYYNEHKEERKDYYKRYREKKENKIKINNYIKQKKENDKLYEYKDRLRHLIKVSISKMGYTKKSKTYEILGCDFDTAYTHLLKTYKDNYGDEYDFKQKVHIDHIIPISTAKTEEEVNKLNHYTNLQLLKQKDNLSKSNHLDWILERK